MEFAEEVFDQNLLPWQKQYLNEAFRFLESGQARFHSFSISSNRGKTYIGGVMRNVLKRRNEPMISWIDESIQWSEQFDFTQKENERWQVLMTLQNSSPDKSLVQFIGNLVVLDTTNADIWRSITTGLNATNPVKNVGVCATPNAQQTLKKA